MTKLIYLTDSYQKTLETAVLDIGNKGNQTWVILKETIFYPAGGGQPSDQGRIEGPHGSLAVSHVSYNDGKPLHLGKVDGDLKKGDKVNLQIDWQKRYRNMQVHTAGHIIHEVIKEIAPEVEPLEGEHGKHPSIQYKGIVDELLKQDIEKKSNDIISQNLEITSKFVTKEELAIMLTKVPDYLPTNKRLRVISLGSYPPTPDGGTQVRETGEVPAISISAIDYDQSGNSTVSYEVAHVESKVTSEIVQNNEPVEDFEQLKSEVLKLIKASKDIDSVRFKVMGKKGLLNETFKKVLGDMKFNKSAVGLAFNKLKQELEEEFEDKKTTKKGVEKEPEADLTLPGTPIPVGLLHPVNAVAREINEIFHGLGFSVADGPELETDEYNYNRLNLPMDHPARDLQDSLYIKEPDILLRTHTSSVEAHILAEKKPPYRYVFPGKCYRFENVNASNHMMFYQYQGLAVGEGISLANLKSTFDTFLRKFYGEKTKSRFRCKYYPEVEPGVGVDIQCPFCQQKGCSVCKFRGWVEIAGAGMVHPNMLRRVELDPRKYSGFAFGMGLDRLAMTRYGINDIRALFNGDLVYKV
ncbi:MAG: Phenylalanine-tRNA ligase alpha subunit [Microgenomates group bacterium GW2011_GWA2_44_7]|uniref:alanine--tRNA ligase n=1 Tax=Candidatus Woesebacteria bacterium GW2011_GWA1_43_12 TaxID=1618557 RepID=A0A0G1FU96_9BACT|nr:MAG: Phenylalanine-tRNA ligase alpha subunit [Candidatus Woesebacteria bacterium GW2011_GWA1_43_12]KKT76248.1 MAG: Phenylalanine-tRNA ligase alpha subunit [Microgenomates group bacterium GW2011_GWA2_44_7]KKT77722.1 MAG: Phenylalanine-tRNA ligase alpha subunit [Microgenomates group bacterium GW2011_GWB1_44_8]